MERKRFLKNCLAALGPAAPASLVSCSKEDVLAGIATDTG